MIFKPKNRNELIDIIEEISVNQLIDCDIIGDTIEITEYDNMDVDNLHGLINQLQYPYGLKDVDVSLIKDLSSIFKKIDIDWDDPRNDITQWDTSNVTNMESMFFGSTFNQDISTKVELQDNSGNRYIVPIEKVNLVMSKKDIGKKIKVNSEILGLKIDIEDDEPEGLIDIINIDKEEITLNNSSDLKMTIVYNNVDLDSSSDEELKKLLEDDNKSEEIVEVQIKSVMWQVDKVTDMSKMFAYSIFNQDINNWNVSNVKNMAEMFNFSNFNQDISSWDVSNVKFMYGIFKKSSFNKNVYNWKLNKFCDLEYFNKNSKHSKTYGNIDNYNEFYNNQLTNRYIFSILTKGDEKEKYKILKYLKSNKIVKNRFIKFLKDYNEIIDLSNI